MSHQKQYIRDGRSPIPKNELTSRVMSSIGDKNTKPELLLRKALWNIGLRGYRLHWKKAPGRPDIAFPGRKVAIFVNGCYWHRCPICKPKLPKTNTEFWREKFKKNVLRDRKNTKELISQRWMVLTFWECELKKDILKCAAKVKNSF